MASNRILDRPVSLRHDDSEEDYVSEEDEVEQSVSTQSGDESNTDISSVDGDQDMEEENEEQDPLPQNNEAEDLKDISFGVLAKAQESFAPLTNSRKRKLATLESGTDQTSTKPTIDNPHPTPDTLSKKPKQDVATRTSKHAPTVLSSRNPVSRKRQIISPPPVHKSRDPRFDPAITARTLDTNSIANASKAYSFLTDYQATEILALKSQIKKAEKSNTDQVLDLKRKLMSMESRLRNAQTQSKEREILRNHRVQEKQAIKEGKKSRPYFLKKSDLRKEVERDRVEGMGKKQRDKMEKRKRMREKTKDAKDMPWARRMG